MKTTRVGSAADCCPIGDHSGDRVAGHRGTGPPTTWTYTNGRRYSGHAGLNSGWILNDDLDGPISITHARPSASAATTSGFPFAHDCRSWARIVSPCAPGGLRACHLGTRVHHPVRLALHRARLVRPGQRQPRCPCRSHRLGAILRRANMPLVGLSEGGRPSVGCRRATAVHDFSYGLGDGHALRHGLVSHCPCGADQLLAGHLCRPARRTTCRGRRAGGCRLDRRDQRCHRVRDHAPPIPRSGRIEYEMARAPLEQISTPRPDELQPPH